jgi:hypothetical protein
VGGSLGIAKKVAEKGKIAEKNRAPGLKPSLITGGLRGPEGPPEGPLFHGGVYILAFFRSL